MCVCTHSKYSLVWKKICVNSGSSLSLNWLRSVLALPRGVAVGTVMSLILCCTLLLLFLNSGSDLKSALPQSCQPPHLVFFLFLLFSFIALRRVGLLSGKEWLFWVMGIPLVGIWVKQLSPEFREEAEHFFSVPLGLLKHEQNKAWPPPGVHTFPLGSLLAWGYFCLALTLLGASPVRTHHSSI